MSLGIKRHWGPVATIAIGVTISVVGFALALHWDTQVIRTQFERTWRPWGVLAIGLLLTCILAIYLIMQKRAKNSIEEQLNFLETLINTIPSPIFYKDIEGVYLGCNSAFEAYIGRSKAEVVGKTVYDIAPEELANVYRKADLALFSAPGVQQHEASVRYADGSRHDILFTKATFSDYFGRVAGLVGVMLDITERKQAERVLENSEARLRQIIDLVPHMIFAKDWDGKYLLVNRAVAEGYNTTVTALTGKNHAELHPDENELQRMLQDDREVMRSEKTMFIPEEAYTDAQGNLRFLQTTKVPFHTNGGNMRAVLAVAIDITERKRVESALKESKERLSQILDFLPDPTFAIDLKGKVISWNKAIEQMTGLKAENILGKGDYEYALPFYGDRRPILIDLVFRPDEEIREKHPLVKKDGDILQTEANVPLREGEIHVLAGKARPLYDSTGSIIGAIESIRDVTALRKAQEMLQDSEERYRSVVENMQDVFYRTNKKGTITMTSPSAFGMLGYDPSSEETLAMHVENCWMFPHEREELLRRIQQDGFVRDYEVTLRKKDGTPLFASVTSVFRRDRDGNVLGVEGVIRDITERKRAEEDRMRLVRAIEQITEGIIITDANWIIQYANPAFERITGYGREEIIGRHTRILKSDTGGASSYRKIRETLSRGEGWSGRLISKKKDSTLYEAEVTGSAIQDRAGAIINYVSIHRDITHEVQLEKELRQAQKMETIGTLAGGIAHDFNNILTPIIGFTELAQTRIPEGSVARRNLEQVLNASFRAKELVKQILTFSRQTEQEKKPVLIGPIIKEALKLLRSSLPSTIKISEEITIGQGGDMILADPTQIHQVLMNLCTNAAHAMRTNGGILSVTLSAAADTAPASEHLDRDKGQYIVLTVSDTGHGIEAALIERIFDPYFTTKGPGEGTGLGLSVVQGIVKSHGGKIDVSSEPGRGTTFHVFLPRFEEETSPEVPKAETAPTGSERILFVDDEQVLVDLGKEILESLGYSVTARTSSLEAMQAFQREPDSFDLIIVDMTMPELTGRDFAKESLAIRADIPIILCTGFSEQINRKQAMEAGIRELVMKPYSVVSLAKTIRSVLERGGFGELGAGQPLEYGVQRLESAD